MMSDLDVLKELIKDQALVLPDEETDEETHCGKKTVVLSESGSQGRTEYEIKIKEVPNDAIVIKTDIFPSPQNIFRCHNGECKRADYVIVTNSKTESFIVYIEMKKSKGYADEIKKQLKGSECFISYCQSIVDRFWQRSHFLDLYQGRFVSFRKIRIRKSLTRKRIRPAELNDDPERMLRISDVRNGGEVYFGRLIQDSSHY